MSRKTLQAAVEAVVGDTEFGTEHEESELDTRGETDSDGEPDSGRDPNGDGDSHALSHVTVHSPEVCGSSTPKRNTYSQKEKGS